MLLVDESLADLLDQMNKFAPVNVPKWIKKDQI